MTADNLYVGCMTGTSVDGLDLALIEVDDSGAITIVAGATRPLPDQLGEKICSRSVNYEDDDIDLLGSCDQALGVFTAKAINSLRESEPRPTTIRWQPRTNHPSPTARQLRQSPFTLQIGDPNIIAELTQITTVADFAAATLLLEAKAHL